MSEYRFNELNMLGEKIIAHFHNQQRNDLEIKVKTPNDVVTKIDHEMDSFIKNLLHEIDAGVSVLSEEDVHSDGFRIDEGCEYEPCWLIDPLDGTSNFVQEIPISASSLAKCIGGKVVEAVTIDLWQYDIYTAIQGLGCRLNGEKISPKKCVDIKLVGASSGVVALHSSSSLVSSSASAKRINLRNFGSQALHLAFVSTGRLSATLSVEARAWDDAAGSLLIEESGGHYQSPILESGSTWISLAASDARLSSRAYVDTDSLIMLKETIDRVYD